MPRATILDSKFVITHSYIFAIYEGSGRSKNRGVGS